MDSKTFLNKLAKSLSVDTKEAASLVSALSSALCQNATNLDTTAIPGFGNFISSKQVERVGVDPATGQNTLYPPEIRLDFSASQMLKKQIEHE